MNGERRKGCESRFVETELYLCVDDVARLARRNGHLVIGESDVAGWGSNWSLVAELRGSRRGLVLQPDSQDADFLFRMSFPLMRRVDFPDGRGVYVVNGKVFTVQLPLPVG